MSNPDDPRVFFAAERTLLAWTRTSLALMAFGFVIERFGLFMHLLVAQRDMPLQRGSSFWVGLSFVLLGAWVAASSTLQYRRVLARLRPGEIPAGYQSGAGVVINLAIAALGLLLLGILFVSGG